MNIHWCSLKTDCTIKFFIPKLSENTLFHNFNVTHAVRNNCQVTITFMKTQENTLINTEKMIVDEHALVLIKTDCTIKFSIPKLYENTPFHNFNVNHDGRKNHQATITFMKNQQNTLINSEKMEVDEHTLCSLKTDCTIKCFIPKLYENTPFNNFNVTHACRKM